MFPNLSEALEANGLMESLPAVRPDEPKDGDGPFAIIERQRKVINEQAKLLLIAKEYVPSGPASGDRLDPLSEQIGGSHYKDMAIQPVQYIHANEIGFFEGNAISYLSRWEKKGGIEDLRKAIHHINLLIAFEEAKQQ
jgi:hypothetical protein